MLKEIQKILREKADAKVIASTQKFVPGSQKVYGVKMPVLNELAVRFTEGGTALVEALWASGAFEEKVLAAKLLRKVAKKNPDFTLQFVAAHSAEICNWVEADTLGMQSIKPILKIRDTEIFALSEKFVPSKNFWQRRLSLVLLEDYTKYPAYHPAIKKRIKQLENDPEYYVKKAIVWLKRNFEKER